MMEAWRPLLFADEDQEAKETRHPVKPAQRSSEAQKKATTKKLADDSLVHSFQTLLSRLAAIVRNTCIQQSKVGTKNKFDVDTEQTGEQRRAFDLLKSGIPK